MQQRASALLAVNSCSPKVIMCMHVVLTQADSKALPDKRALVRIVSAMMTTKHANLCPPTISVWIQRVLTSDVDGVIGAGMARAYKSAHVSLCPCA